MPKCSYSPGAILLSHSCVAFSSHSLIAGGATFPPSPCLLWFFGCPPSSQAPCHHHSMCFSSASSAAPSIFSFFGCGEHHHLSLPLNVYPFCHDIIPLPEPPLYIFFLQSTEPPCDVISPPLSPPRYIGLSSVPLNKLPCASPPSVISKAGGVLFSYFVDSLLAILGLCLLSA